MSATGKVALSRLGAHILGWLLCHPDGGTARELMKANKPLLDQRGSEAEQLQLVEAELAAFKRAGFVSPLRKASFKLTKSGRDAVLGVLRWEKLPPNADWRVVKTGLAAFVGEEKTPPLEGPVDEIPAVFGEGAAKVLVSAFRLTVSPTPTFPQVIGALAWHAIGVKTSEPFTAPSVIRVLLSRLAGAPTLLPLEQAIELLVAKGAAAAPIAPAAPNEVPLPADDGAFAARVLKAARASKTGRFGDDKVFISHVLRQLTDEGAGVNDAEAFKDRLVSVHRRGLLSLSRADLVEAMDPKDVDASETRYLSATFHFVRV